MKQTLAVLFGGASSEYGVSLQSAAGVLGVVNTARYSVVRIGITRQGRWLLYEGPEEEIAADRWWRHASCRPCVLSCSPEEHGVWILGAEGAVLRRLDIIFPVLHGRGGEDGGIQGLLELGGISFVGCGCLSSALCMDKDIAHRLAAGAGIDCPVGMTLYREDGTEQALCENVLRGMAHIPFPWFVKPAAEGSSFGVTRVADCGALPAALHEAFAYGGKIVVEQGISGFEVGCAVLGNAQPYTGEVDAIALAGGFFDYHEKYSLETAQILLPAPIFPAQAEAVKQLALDLYRLFGCRGFARVDLFVTKTGRLVFNEINTLPGLTPHSRFPGMLRQAGISFADAVQTLLDLAVEP